MDIEKPKIQKVVINMSHAWKPEEKQQKENQEKAKEKKDSPERKEYPCRLGTVKQFLEKRIAKYTDDNYMATFFQEKLDDLSIGNERSVLTFLESSYSNAEANGDLDEWRMATLELNNELSRGNILSSNEIGTFLNEEFEEKQNRFNLELEKNPENFSKDDIKKIDKDILSWQDASNEILFDNGYKKALILIEKEIEELTEYVRDKRDAIVTTSKQKSPNLDSINRLKKDIDANVSKIERFRRMRNSIYETNLKK